MGLGGLYPGSVGFARKGRRGGAPWDVDALSQKGVPSSLTQWSKLITAKSLGLSAGPPSIWLCQEAAGNLADSGSAGVVLTASTSPLYSQTDGSWARHGVGTTDGTGRQGFSGTGPDPSSTSIAMLIYAKVSTPGASGRYLMSFGGTATTNDVDVRLVTNPAARLVNPAAGTTGLDNPTGSVRPYLLVNDRTNSRCVLFTDQEVITATYGSVVVNGQTVLGAPSAYASIAPGAAYFYACQFRGTDASWLSTTANARSFLTALAWTIPW